MEGSAHMSPKAVVGLLKESFSDWSEDKASRLAAALAYYAMFSLGPLVLIMIAIAGLVFGEEAARNQIVGQLDGLLGTEGAEAIQTMIQAASREGTGIIATIVGIAMLLFGAMGVFGQLQDALNTVWEVKPKEGRGIMGMVKDRFLSFTMVLGVGFLLTISLVLSAALAAIVNYFATILPGDAAGGAIAQGVDLVFSFAVLTVLFAAIYKVLPDAKIAWSDVWLGAAFTSLLFVIGRFAISTYIGQAGVGSAYGAAGSVVVLLIWVYYSAQILFFGAEFTQVYSRKYGTRIVPAEGAEPVTEEERAQQGIPHEGGETRAEHPRPEAGRAEAGNGVSSGIAAAIGVIAGAIAVGVGMLLSRRNPIS